MSRRTRILFALTGIAAATTLVACGSDDDGGNDNGGSVTTTDDATSGDDAAAGATVELADSPLGEILVDSEGRTLYLFTNDSPGTSVCEGDCLANWPALEGEAQAGDGVDDGLLGTIERSDGTVQASYGDWPLYYFAADAAPGDVNGQGVNDVWYVINAEGRAVKEAPSDSGSSADTGY